MDVIELALDYGRIKVCVNAYMCYRYVVIVYVIVLVLVCENEWFSVGLVVKRSYCYYDD